MSLKKIGTAYAEPARAQAAYSSRGAASCITFFRRDHGTYRTIPRFAALQNVMNQLGPNDPNFKANCSGYGVFL